MSKKTAPAKHTVGGGSAAASHSNRSEPAMSNSEITSLIEKKISEALSKHATQSESETKNQKWQDVDTKLKQLSAEFQGANKDQSQRVENVEKVLHSLQLSHDQLERRLKSEIDRIVEEKVRLIQQKKVQLEAGKESYANQRKWSAIRDAAHQEELSKLRQQHHQDMLSVINDCCRKVKGGFTRQHKPYDVNEIHAVIDDIEQKMVDEMFLEIQKTDTHEEAVESATHSRELGEARDDGVKTTKMTTEDISAALETFENENFDNWSEELRPSKNAGGGELFEGLQGSIVEEVISKTQGIIAGDRGNPYYIDELKRNVDEMMSVTGNVQTKKDSEDLAPNLPPPKVKNYHDIEASLDSMMVSDNTADDSQSKTKAVDLPELKTLEAKIASDISSGPESPSEIFKKDLTSLDALIGAGLGGEPSPDAFTRDLLSLDAKIDAELPKSEASASPSSSKGDQHSKSPETKIAADAKGSTGGQGQSRSPETKIAAGAKGSTGGLEDINKDAAGKAKGDAVVVKQSTPTKDQGPENQSQGASAKHEKQPTKETPAPVVSKDSAKKT